MLQAGHAQASQLWPKPGWTKSSDVGLVLYVLSPERPDHEHPCIQAIVLISQSNLGV